MGGGPFSGGEDMSVGRGCQHGKRGRGGKKFEKTRVPGMKHKMFLKEAERSRGGRDGRKHISLRS